MTYKKMTEKEKIATWVCAFYGAFCGMGAIVYFAIAVWPHFLGPSESGTLLNIKLINMIFQVASLVLLMIAFAFIFISLKIKWWYSIPIGALAGGISGGASFGISNCLLTFMAAFTGSLDLIDDQVITIWRVTGSALIFGLKTGSLIGILAGMVAGFALSFVLGYHREHEEIDYYPHLK